MCWFHTDTSRRPELGYYLGNGEVRLLSAPKQAQGFLDLERVTAWRPFSEKLMEKFESD